MCLQLSSAGSRVQRTSLKVGLQCSAGVMGGKGCWWGRKSDYAVSYPLPKHCVQGFPRRMTRVDLALL